MLCTVLVELLACGLLQPQSTEIAGHREKRHGSRGTSIHTQRQTHARVHTHTHYNIHTTSPLLAADGVEVGERAKLSRVIQWVKIQFL